ncbi:MAG: hypothetical protein V8T45_09625 [Oscillospiraceae bacterium]
MKKLEIFDSTLRDGAQGEGVSFSVEDKLRIAGALDRAGVGLIEAGNPFSNPKDAEFFRRANTELCLKTRASGRFWFYAAARRQCQRGSKLRRAFGVWRAMRGGVWKGICLAGARGARHDAGGKPGNDLRYGGLAERCGDSVFFRWRTLFQRL